LFLFKDFPVLGFEAPRQTGMETGEARGVTVATRNKSIRYITAICRFCHKMAVGRIKSRQPWLNSLVDRQRIAKADAAAKKHIGIGAAQGENSEDDTMYEVMFWIWFVGACGFYAYYLIVGDDDEIDNTVSAIAWPVVLGGIAFAFAWHFIIRLINLSGD
jgi:hypothetical protein